MSDFDLDSRHPSLQVSWNDAKGASNGSYRVMRGGSNGSEPIGLRCANCSREVLEGRSYTYGFRLVIVPSH